MRRTLALGAALTLALLGCGDGEPTPFEEACAWQHDGVVKRDFSHYITTFMPVANGVTVPINTPVYGPAYCSVNGDRVVVEGFE